MVQLFSVPLRVSGLRPSVVNIFFRCSFRLSLFSVFSVSVVKIGFCLRLRRAVFRGRGFSFGALEFSTGFR